jgi:DNA-binding HxlR family transcriptional regulator
VGEEEHVSTSTGNVYDPSCASRRAFDVITGRWSGLVIAYLQGGPRRWSEVRRAVGGVSDKMLAQTLRETERLGLVHREVHATTPPQVSYRLTPLGADLAPRLVALADWVEEHVSEFAGAFGADEGPHAEPARTGS